MSELAALCQEIATCTRCVLYRGRTKAVPGEGPEDADIMFIGEGPGFHEDQQGRPFVGAAGQFLEELLESIGLKREQVYITNVIKCFVSPRVLIYTLAGYKPIKDIQIGELVLTHTGQFCSVVYVRPHEILPAGSELVRITVRAQDTGNHKPVHITVTPEHPFLVNSEWKPARDIRAGDHVRALGDRCEVCGRSFYVRYDRYDTRVYRTCSPKCHNKRIMHSPEVREKIRETMKHQYGEATHPIGYGEQELKVILDEIEVDYFHHFALPDSAFTYDFCLPAERILIEVRGPGFSNRDAQQRALIKDELAKQHGYLVVNLWWHQIVQRPAMVKAVIERLLRNHHGEYTFVDIVVTEVEHHKAGRNFPLYNIGIEGDESYVAAGIVSHNCRPPGNRDPLPDEIEACRPYLDRQIELIHPRIVVTLGRFSMARWFPKARISRIHGQPRKMGGVIYYPMYHPAAALHQPSLRRTVEEDMQHIPELIAEMEQIAEYQPPDEAQQLSLF